MLTEAMKRSGWRECPSDEVRRAWEDKGGRWQVALHWFNIGKPRDRGAMTLLVGEERPREADEPYRPVSAQTWDYDPRGWGDVVGPESKQWGEWWWWQCEGLPLQAVMARRCDDGGFRLVINGIELSLSELGGRFIAPIPVPEVS